LLSRRTSPPSPLSNYASLRDAAWRGGTWRFHCIISPSPHSGEAAELERGPGGVVRIAGNSNANPYQFVAQQNVTGSEISTVPIGSTVPGMHVPSSTTTGLVYV
jgi:hypothetical protein